MQLHRNFAKEAGEEDMVNRFRVATQSAKSVPRAMALRYLVTGRKPHTDKLPYEDHNLQRQLGFPDFAEVWRAPSHV